MLKLKITLLSKRYQTLAKQERKNSCLMIKIKTIKVFKEILKITK